MQTTVALLVALGALIAAASAAVMPLRRPFGQQVVKRSGQGLDDVEGVCRFYHRKCLVGENSTERCEASLTECLNYGRMLLRGSYKLCMFRLEDASECQLRQASVINKLARYGMSSRDVSSPQQQPYARRHAAQIQRIKQMLGQQFPPQHRQHQSGDQAVLYL
ncbi:unnamed protein product, partial [Mesorhabditis spiculigera]